MVENVGSGINSSEVPLSPEAELKRVQQQIKEYYYQPDMSLERLDAVRAYTADMMNEVLFKDKPKELKRSKDAIQQRAEKDTVFGEELGRVTKFADELNIAVAATSVSEFDRFNTVFDFLSRDIWADRERQIMSTAMNKQK